SCVRSYAAMRKLMVIAAIGVLCAAGAHAADPQKPPKRRLEVRVTPEMIRHSRINDVLYFIDFPYGVGALLLILGAGWSARFRDFASRVARKKLLAAMLYYVFFALALTSITFPLDFYGGYVVPHQFDLTNQSFAAWMGDFAKAVGVNLAVGAPIAA